MEKNIHFRAVIEVLGKPKEHVDSALKSYIQKLKEDAHYIILKEELVLILRNMKRTTSGWFLPN